MNENAPRTNEPHAYESIGTPGWRTCAICGAGANAQIHRKPQ